MVRRAGGLLLLAVLAGCDGDDVAEDRPAPPEPTIPLRTRSFEAATGDLPNPERGAYVWVDLFRGKTLTNAFAGGYRLGFASVSLASWRSAPLDAAFLDGLGSGLAAARNAGLKVILRFRYSSAIGEADASKARILEHIGQLAPVLQANADVIAVLQAGFIGAWGEWHASTHRLDNPADESDVLGALLAALPASRMIQVRTPRDKRAIFGPDAVGEAEAWTGTGRSRVGHHNDAFLASANDFGTYRDPVQAEKDWLASDARFVPVGGESAAVNPPHSDGPEALKELQALRWSFINVSYHKSVVERWRQQGCLEEIRNRVGYRLGLLEASWPERTAPGGAFELAVRLKNDGFAAAYNERPVDVVLSNAVVRRSARLSLDARRWAPGVESSFTARLRLPPSLPPGTYRLALRLPDPSPSLQARPEYAIAFANRGTWDAETGDNVLTEQFLVEHGAPGLVDPDAVELEP
jgi:hypothetical protein